MAFKIIRNDITKVKADAIVNTANPLPIIGMGTDSSIYKAAGEERLLAARIKIGVINEGESAWTESYNLKAKGIKYIIHTVGTSYEGGSAEVEVLRRCYSSSLALAKELGCKSIAIPLLATGFYSFPKELGLQVAIDEISSFLMENEIEVILVVYDKKSYLISEKLFDDIQNYLDENLDYEPEKILRSQANGWLNRDYCECFEYIEEKKKPKSEKKKSKAEKTGVIEAALSFAVKNNRFDEDFRNSKSLGVVGESHAIKKEIAPIDVDAFIRDSSKNLNFQNNLQRLISERKLENVEVYSKAMIDRKFFSKIISNKNYVPKKMTVMALGLALELPLGEYEEFLASAGYAFMPSSKFDLIVKYCVSKEIYNLVEIDVILESHGETCFAPE